MTEVWTIDHDIDLPTLTESVDSTAEDGTTDGLEEEILLPSLFLSTRNRHVGSESYSIKAYIRLPALNPDLTEAPGYTTLDLEVCRLLPGLFDFHMKQGAAFHEQVIWYDSSGNAMDLTDYEAELVAKVSPSDETALFTISSAGVGDEGVITLGGGNGTIDIYMSADETTDLSFSRAFYDLRIIVDGDDDVTLLEGTVYLTRGIL